MCMSTGMGMNSRPITVHLDEFANIGTIPSFSSLITTLRKRRVCVNIYIQSIEQVEKNYKLSDAILFGGINTHIYLNSLSPSTSEKLSRRIGNFTVEDAEKGTRHGRNLITSSEIHLMKSDVCLMLHKNFKPAMFKITPYYENKRLLELSQQSISSSDFSYPPLPDLEFVPLPKPPQKPNKSSDPSDIVFDL